VAICQTVHSDNNILVLDGSTNYLDIKAIEALEEALINTDKTLILVCHDKKFIEDICDHIIEIKDKHVKEFDGSYREYLYEKNKLR
jgi:macrolide transport system ATP-binding/permease protein